MEKSLGDLIPAVGAPSPERDDPRDGAGAVTRRGEASLDASLDPPNWSQSGTGVLWRFMHAHPNAGLPWDFVTPADEAEAKRHLPRLRKRAAIATHEQWHMFLRRVAAMTLNPPMNTDAVKAFDAFVSEVHEAAMRGTCAGALVDGLGECQREKLFPKPEALNRILGPLHRRAIAELSAAECMARGNPLAKALDEAERERREEIERDRAAAALRFTERERWTDEQAAARRAEVQASAAKYGEMPEPILLESWEAESARIDAVARERGGARTPEEEYRLAFLWLRTLNRDLKSQGRPLLTMPHEAERGKTLAEWTVEQYRRYQAALPKPDRREHSP